MTLPSLRDGFSVARMSARQRVESSIDLHRLFRVIDSDPAIVGAGVVYIDSDFNVLALRDFQAICSVVPKTVVLREAPRYMAAQEFVRALETNPRESQAVFEALGMYVSCAGAFMSWSVFSAGGTVLIPFSAGTSTVIVSIGIAAAVAAGAQCVNGVLRTDAAIWRPEHNDWLDSEAWYNNVLEVLDAVSLAGVGSTTLSAVRLAKLVKSSTGKSWRADLKRLSRQERVKLTNELLLIKDPRITAKLLRLKQMAGDLPKRFTPAQIKHGTAVQITDCLGASFGLIGSATSGHLRAIAIGVYSGIADD